MADRSRRKTCNLSIRVTPYELTWLAEQAQANGCLNISEYTRGVLFRPPKTKGQSQEYGPQIAHLEKDLRELRQDVEKLFTRLGK